MGLFFLGAIQTAVSWDGLRNRLAFDIGAADTELTVRFMTGWEAKVPPFDLGMGLERVTVTAIADTIWTLTRGVNGSTPVPHYRGAIFQELRHQMIVTKGGQTWDYSLIADKSFQHGSAIPVGETECQIAFETTEDGWVPDGDSHLVLSSNESGSWEAYYSGLVQRPSYVERDDESLDVNLTARGYGHSTEFDEYVQTTKPGDPPDTFDDGVGWWRAFTPGHTIVEDVLRDKCPLISGDYANIVDGDQSIGKEFNGTSKTPKAILDEVCAQGDVGEALDWAVYTDTDGAAKLYLYRRSRWRTLNIPWSTVAKAPNELPFAWDTDELKTRIVVYYAGGYAVAEGPGAIVRTQSFHCENTIDDLWTANYIAQSILAESGTLQLLTESPLVLTYKADDPSTHYVTDALSGDEIPLWRIKAGWLVAFPDISPRNANLPITSIQVKNVSINHLARTVTLQLGTFWDFAKIANLYAHEQAKAPNSPTHLPGVVGTVVVPPDGAPMPGSISPSAASLGPTGKVGRSKVANDGDIVEIPWLIVGGTDVIPTGRELQPDMPFHLNGDVVGFRMSARDGTEPSGVVNLEIDVGYTPSANVPNIGTTFSTLAISAGNVMNPSPPADQPGVNLDPDQDTNPPPFPGIVQPVATGDHLTWNVTANDAAKVIEIAILVRLAEGSDRALDPNAPRLISHTISRDAANIMTFAIVADRACYAQIEFGTTDDYGSFSRKTEVPIVQPSLPVPGLPATGHYRILLFNPDGVKSTSNDHTF